MALFLSKDQNFALSLTAWKLHLFAAKSRRKYNFWNFWNLNHSDFKALIPTSAKYKKNFFFKSPFNDFKNFFVLTLFEDTAFGISSPQNYAPDSLLKILTNEVIELF